MLVYDDGVGITGAVIYRATHGAEMLFFLGFGEILAARYDVVWPCEPADIPDCGYIGSLAVFDGATGQGIGLTLIQAAQEKIREADNPIAYLCVSDFNTRAQRFYVRHGYKLIGVTQGKRSIEHLMEKAL
jgi:ribosomal protein S18 acetylase RimI-like enzyme